MGELRLWGIYPEKALGRHKDKIGLELVGYGPPDGEVKTLPEVVERCGQLRAWIDGPLAQELGWKIVLGSMFTERRQTARDMVLPLVRQLVDTAVRLGWAERPAVDGRLDKTGVLVVLNRVCVWAKGERQSEQPSKTEKKRGLSLKETSERLERLRAGGEPFTSQRKISDLIGSNVATVNKAIQQSDTLSQWAVREKAVPRAQSLNEVVTDRKAQGTEIDPADDAAIREFIESADEQTRGWFLALPIAEQVAYLDGRDDHGRILGRKP